MIILLKLKSCLKILTIFSIKFITI